MYQYQDQKEMRRALNGKMIVMLVGIMLVVTALTSSLTYGMRCLSMAKMADNGDKEVLEAMKQISISSGTLRVCGVVYYIEAIIETLVGVFCFRLNNRLDKAALLWKMAWGILGAEVLAGAALTALHMISPFMIISNLLLPAFLLWAVNGLKKVAKNYPDRIYAVEPNNKNKKNGNTSRQPAKPVQKKSLMERATVQVVPEEVIPPVKEAGPEVTEHMKTQDQKTQDQTAEAGVLKKETSEEFALDNENQEKE